MRFQAGFERPDIGFGLCALGLSHKGSPSGIDDPTMAGQGKEELKINRPNRLRTGKSAAQFQYG
jgi:hypothetical protein